MARLLDSDITKVAQFSDALDRSGFGFEAGEGSDGSLEVGLSSGRKDFGTGRVILDRSGADHFPVPFLDSLNDEALDQFGLDRDSLRAIGATAPVDDVVLPVKRHGQPARSAAQNTQTTEQPPVPLAATLHRLTRPPRFLIDQGFVSVEVDQLPKVDLPPVDASAEHGSDAGVGLDDAVVSEEGSDLGQRCAFHPKKECPSNCGGRFCLREERPIWSSNPASRRPSPNDPKGDR